MKHELPEESINEASEIIKSMGKEALLANIGTLNFSQKEMLLNVLQSMKMQKSVSMDDVATPPKTKVELGELEVEIQTADDDHDEKLVKEGASTVSHQGDPSPEGTQGQEIKDGDHKTVEVKKSVQWPSATQFIDAKTYGRNYHVDAESILFAETKEEVNKAEENLSELETLILEGKDQSALSIKLEKSLKEEKEKANIELKKSFTEDQIIESLNLTAEQVKEILGE